MDLARDWRRRAFGAAGAAVVAPVAIIAAALAVGVGGGGLRGMRSLGQALTGPQLPAVEAAAAVARDAPGGAAGDVLPRVIEPSRRGARDATRRASRAPAPGATRGAPRPGGKARPQRRRPTGSAPANGSPGSPGPAPTPTPPPQSTTRQVAERVKEEARKVPVAGEPAADVVELIVDTAEGLPVPLP